MQSYTEMENFKEEKARENASQITDILNSSNAYPSHTGKEITNEHRYLQGEFWTLVEGFIEESAKKYADRRFDDRNAYAVKMSAKIAPLLEQFRMEIANER